jgi:enoyl-CoA hydratase
VVYPREEFESSWRSLVSLIASSPSRAIKSVIAPAAPNHHESLEGTAAAAFASLWVGDAHWAAVDERLRLG